MAVIKVVKYNGTPDVFAWKFPDDELATWTQLIVNESQEAVLFKGGQAQDLFTSGRYTLETQNIPVLNKIINIPFGGRSPFAAEVWYINKVYSLDVKWGSPTPIQLQDPKYKVFIPVRSFGQFGIQIDNSRKFLIKLVGTLPSFDKRNVEQYFRGLLLTRVKDTISSYLVRKQISVLEINAYLNEISDSLRDAMLPTLDEYGIKLVNFYVNDISVPENDPAVTKLKTALAKRAEMDIVGFSYVQERSFDALEGAATNPGSGQGGVMGTGIGLGMGVGIGSGFGSQMGGLVQNLSTASEKKSCPGCGTPMDKALRFCSKCGIDTEKQAAVRQAVACGKCGTNVSADMNFCPKCGDKVAPQQSGPAAGRFCPQCGYNAGDDHAFCPKCGTKL
jgi:membrane protease subunit (stomatin/prohibitin family)